MTRNLKILGIVMAAMFALSAVGASSASAAADKLTAVKYPVNLHASQEVVHVFTPSPGRQVTCKKATFTGTLAAASSEVTITPVYEECHAIILGTTLSATVTMNGCDYTLTGNPSGSTENSEVHILCPGGNKITIDIYSGATHFVGEARFCELHVGPQTRTGLKYINQAGGSVTVEANVANIATERTGSAICGAVNQGAGTYIGSSVLTATDDPGGGAVAIDVGQ